MIGFMPIVFAAIESFKAYVINKFILMITFIKQVNDLESMVHCLFAVLCIIP